ncbi:hypothetical protein ABZ591_27640 [Micromonospora fulviviridis]|uniref:hypothetical protein n=1 Tax=Micromonospora fulviviridis TaxID=47860 RepID=UPI0033CB122F
MALDIEPILPHSCPTFALEERSKSIDDDRGTPLTSGFSSCTLGEPTTLGRRQLGGRRLMRKSRRGFLRAGPVTVVAAAALLLGALPAAARPADPEPAAPAAPAKAEVRQANKHDLSQKLRDVAPKKGSKVAAQPARSLDRQTADTSAKAGSDAVQRGFTATQVPEFAANFEGVGNVDGVLPPDTNGDVGPNHYVQMVNLHYAVYNKTGNLLLGPLPANTIWSGFGGPCETRNDGDPVVLYDEAADRWMVTQFALPGGSSGNHQCMAISQTGDPTGAYFRYDFLYHQTRMNDYPKYGIWPDAYYMTANEFAPSFVGVGAVAFEREKMLSGQAARMVYFHLGPDYGGVLPSDAEGLAPPPRPGRRTRSSCSTTTHGVSRPPTGC